MDMKEIKIIAADDVDWRSMAPQYPGMSIKVLQFDRETGFLAALFKMAPGFVLPAHTHTGDEFVYVLQGWSVDNGQKTGGEGTYMYLPANVEHGGSGAVGEEGVTSFAIYTAGSGFEEFLD